MPYATPRPKIGRIQLTKRTPQDVQSLLHRKREEGESPRSVQYIRSILRAALSQALKWGLVARNVATQTDSPAVERYETHPLLAEQAQAFLGAVRGDRLEALYRVALTLGLRRREVLGHANIQTTQNIYTHVFDDAKRQAADALDQILGDRRDAS